MGSRAVGIARDVAVALALAGAVPLDLHQVDGPVRHEDLPHIGFLRLDKALKRAGKSKWLQYGECSTMSRPPRTEAQHTDQHRAQCHALTWRRAGCEFGPAE